MSDPFKLDFDCRNMMVLEQTKEEREADLVRMKYDPVRDDPRKIFLASIPMMRRRIINVVEERKRRTKKAIHSDQQDKD